MGVPIVSEFLTVIMNNPILAWFTVIFILTTDTFLTGLAFPNGAGLVGFIIANVLNFVGVEIPVTSFNILIVVAFAPLLIFALRKSGA